MAITKDGIEIRDLDDWRDRAGPKRTDQWVAHRSAMEAARAWLEGGGQRLPREIESVLRSHPAFGPVIRWDAEPEVQLRFDAFAGEPRNSDLVVHATDAHGPYLIAVEAKADEPFGDTVADTLVAAERRYLQNSNSNGVTRVGQLRQALFGSTEGGDGLPVVEALRYQLLTACAGALRLTPSPTGDGGNGDRSRRSEKAPTDSAAKAALHRPGELPPVAAGLMMAHQYGRRPRSTRRRTR